MPQSQRYNSQSHQYPSSWEEHLDPQSYLEFGLDRTPDILPLESELNHGSLLFPTTSSGEWATTFGTNYDSPIPAYANFDDPLLFSDFPNNLSTIPFVPFDNPPELGVNASGITDDMGRIGTTLFPDRLHATPSVHNSPQEAHSQHTTASPRSITSQDNNHTQTRPLKSHTSSQSSSPKTLDPANRIEKRTRNTLAARRYRQRRVDEVSGLESQLKETRSERDDLKIRCARLEGEVETLRKLLEGRK